MAKKTLPKPPAPPKTVRQRVPCSRCGSMRYADFVGDPAGVCGYCHDLGLAIRQRAARLKARSSLPEDPVLEADRRQALEAPPTRERWGLVWKPCEDCCEVFSACLSLGDYGTVSHVTPKSWPHLCAGCVTVKECLIQFGARLKTSKAASAARAQKPISQQIADDEIPF